MPPSLELPVVQRWSCHSCGGCCRQHLVEITDEERRRIEKQNWPESGEIGDAEPVVPLSARGKQKRWRLNHTPEGACVFLNEEGLCRIHAKFGEAAKPLACRVYPYALHPGPDGKIAVSLRYSCPSVIANRGATGEEASREIRKIAKQVVPRDARKIPAPGVSAREQLDWKEIGRLVEHLDESLQESSEPFLHRLLATIFWISLVDQSRFDKLRGGRIEEFLSLIRPAAAGEVPSDLGEFSAPSRAGRLMFRSHVGQYARLETAADLNNRWRARWRNVRGLARMTRGRGKLPALRPELPPVPFEAIEQSFELPEASEELFSRYFRTKIRGMHFCGRGFYRWPLTEGFLALALMFPVSCYLARWHALGAGRDRLIEEDVEAALAMADHHHGYSPPIGSSSARRRVRLLARGDLPKLCVWYGASRTN